MVWPRSHTLQAFKRQRTRRSSRTLHADASIHPRALPGNRPCNSPFKRGRTGGGGGGGRLLLLCLENIKLGAHFLGQSGSFLQARES
jgi:hypothetical protein